ncbi:MAG TPA: YHS domain-containing (seleno)protein [Gaiellaceae bacterium]|nr:YHS domain-containing (seleno)protein [Gaiellaceae bacterium]
MKGRILALVAVIAIATTTAFAKELVNTDASGVALQGYDPVGFFTDGKPLVGNPAITARYAGATYRFATPEHKAAFEREPTKYAPVFGGYCAYGVAKGGLAPVEISTWQIVDGRLVLNKNASIRKAFDKDIAGNTRDAEANWPKLMEENGR